jgi:large subunit ribosomal protein L14
MIQPETLVKITDNSGGKVGKIFKVLGSSKRRYARIGDLVTLSIQSAKPRKDVKENEAVYGIVVRQTKPFRRKDGSYIRFDENAVVLLENNREEAKGNRVFGPVPRELSEHGYSQIGSLAAEIV